MINDQIKEIALANGFKLKEQLDGSMDLNPYVYEFSRALIAEYLNTHDIFELNKTKAIKGGEAECISGSKNGIALYQNFKQDENILYVMQGDELLFEVEGKRVENHEYVLVDYEVTS